MPINARKLNLISTLEVNYNYLKSCIPFVTVAKNAILVNCLQKVKNKATLYIKLKSTKTVVYYLG